MPLNWFRSGRACPSRVRGPTHWGGALHLRPSTESARLLPRNPANDGARRARAEQCITTLRIAYPKLLRSYGRTSISNKDKRSPIPRLCVLSCLRIRKNSLHRKTHCVRPAHLRVVSKKGKNLCCKLWSGDVAILNWRFFHLEITVLVRSRL